VAWFDAIAADKFLFPAVLLAVSLANELNAQTMTSGGLTDAVTDPSNAVVPGADIAIQDNTKGASQSTKTDQEGVYRLFAIGYSIRFESGQRHNTSNSTEKTLSFSPQTRRVLCFLIPEPTRLRLE
jgi:Carboxypeptidase regulatory-like domain